MIYCVFLHFSSLGKINFWTTFRPNFQKMFVPLEAQVPFNSKNGIEVNIWWIIDGVIKVWSWCKKCYRGGAAVASVGAGVHSAILLLIDIASLDEATTTSHVWQRLKGTVIDCTCTLCVICKLYSGNSAWYGKQDLKLLFILEKIYIRLGWPEGGAQPSKDLTGFV